MDEQGYDDFFAAHHPTVHRALVLSGAPPAVAADVAQEAFVRAYERWRRVRLMEHPRAWVFRVAFNHRRRTAGRDARVVPAAVVVPAGVDGVGPERLDVRDALGRLPERQRTAVVLRYYADLPLAEVAEVMGVAVGTVKSTLHAALASLRIDLEDEELRDE